MAGGFKVISDQPIPELGGAFMQLQRRVGEIGVLEVPVADRDGEPGVIALTRELQYPARHRDRHPHRGAGRGQLTDERVDHFGLTSRDR
jgi:hypothetical protein